MGIEIERRFFVKDDSFKAKSSESRTIVQGYMAIKPDAVIRVRIVKKSTVPEAMAFITLKGRRLPNRIGKPEYEYPVPLGDAENILSGMCGTRIIEKVRYIVYEGKSKWEVDVFGGRHTGLTIAEIELSEENEAVELPEWIGQEITGLREYSNAALSQR